MGWFKDKTKKLASPKQRLIKQFVDEYARLASTVDTYEELFRVVSAERGELQFARAVSIAQTDILDNVSYRMLSFGDPAEQTAVINTTHDKFAQPIRDPDPGLVRSEAFDYRHAYDSLPPVMRDYIGEEAFADYADIVNIFSDHSDYEDYYVEYHKVLHPVEEPKKPSKESPARQNPFKRMPPRSSRHVKTLAQKHVAAGVEVYFEKLQSHLVGDSHTSPKFGRPWENDIGASVYHSKERGNWAAGVAFGTLNQARLKQLGTLDSIIDDGIHHLQNMINEIEEHRIPVQAALEYLQAIHQQQDEDRDLNDVDEDAQERQAMLDKMYNV